MTTGIPNSDPSGPKSTNGGDVYPLIIEHLISQLDEPRDEHWISDQLGVRPVQVRDWLDRAVREGRVSRMAKPNRYVAAQPTLFAS